MQKRYPIMAKAHVQTGSGERFCCELKDISRTGLQFTSGMQGLQTLLPHFLRDKWRHPVAFDIVFSVPTSQCSDVPVELSCVVVYCRRIKMDLFSIGAHFTEFKAGSDVILEDFLALIADRS